MKKIFSNILILTMLVSLFVGIQVNAAAGNYTITASGPATLQSTDATPFDITISLAGATADAPMGPITIKMNFDNTKFTVVNGTAASTGGNGKPKFTVGSVITTARNDLGATISVTTGAVVTGTTTKVAVTLNTDTPVVDANGVLGKFTFTPIAPVAAGNATFAIVVSASDTNANDGAMPPSAHNFTGVNAIVNVQGAVDQPQAAPTGLAAVAPTTSAGTDGKITGTTAAMEYSTSENGTYSPCSADATTVPAAGIYYVRYAAKTGYLASSAVAVTVPAFTKGSQAAPTGLAGVAPLTSDGSGKITGTTTAMEYGTNQSGPFSPCSATETSVAPGTYYVRMAATSEKNASDTVSVTVNAFTKGSQAAPTGLAGVEPTSAAGTDGKITGTTTAMEFSTTENGTYSPCSADATTVPAAGTYYVRMAATSEKNASSAVAVIVPAYVAPTLEPSISISSIADTHQNKSFDVTVKVSNIPASTPNIQFAVEYDSAFFNEPTSVAGAKLDYTGTNGVPGAMGFAYTIKEDLGNNEVIATLTFTVKNVDPATLPATKTLKLYNVQYGAALTAIAGDNITNGIVNITSEVDYAALAETAVAEYEAGALTTLTEVAAAEAKKKAADDAVALVTDATQKAAFALRISNRATAIANARAQLEAIDAAIAAVNSGNYTVANLTTLGVVGAVDAKLPYYKLATNVAKTLKGSALTKTDILDAIAKAMDTELVKGEVDATAGISSFDGALVKDFFLTRQAPTSVEQALKADFNSDGLIDAFDITSVLIEAAKQARVKQPK